MTFKSWFSPPTGGEGGGGGPDIKLQLRSIHTPFSIRTSFPFHNSYLDIIHSKIVVALLKTVLGILKNTEAYH